MPDRLHNFGRISAVDLPSAQQAKDFVQAVGDEAVFYKVGLELFMSGGYFELVEWLVAQRKKVFVDLACSSHNAMWEKNHARLAEPI